MVVPLDQVDAQAVFLRLLTNVILGMAVRLEGARKPKKNVLLCWTSLSVSAGWKS